MVKFCCLACIAQYPGPGRGGGGGDTKEPERGVCAAAPGIWSPLAYMHCSYALSYRRCASWPAAPPLLAPTAVPVSSPPAAPTAAPAPGLPATAPMAAPKPAPRSEPKPAPSAVLNTAARSGVVPACWGAHWRQTASSIWNCSNDLPIPGNAITPGPVGTVAQALNRRPHVETVATVRPRCALRIPVVVIDSFPSPFTLAFPRRPLLRGPATLGSIRTRSCNPDLRTASEGRGWTDRCSASS